LAVAFFLFSLVFFGSVMRLYPLKIDYKDIIIF
jgi:hypothetical protein